MPDRLDHLDEAGDQVELLTGRSHFSSAYIERVRVLAAAGALLFAYLAVIPLAVVGSTLDSACAGSECGYSAPLSVYLVIAFGAAALALAAGAVSMAAYAVHPSEGTARLIRASLKVSVAVIGVVLFSELAITHPVAAIVIAALIVPLALIGAGTRERRPGVGTRRAPG
jgi:hypothetical protein